MEIEHPSFGWIPFNASLGDVEPIGLELYERAVAGEFGPVGEYVEPPSSLFTPQVITMRQARLALLGAGLLAQVDAAIASLPSPQKEAAQIEWEYAATVERNSGLVRQLAPALGLTEAQIDELFVQGAAL